MPENAMTEDQDVLPLPVNAAALLARLQELGIGYELYHHEPVFSVAESEHLKAQIPGLHCRNLFLRDKKEKMFLVVAANETAVDLKKLEGVLGCDRLSFGSSGRLWRYLGVRPGSVCPYAIINDKGGAVSIILDQSMMAADLVDYHPMENHLTICVAPADLVKFIESTGHRAHIIDLSPAAPD
jgi:Ala-tRNA(Pro) deacylase